MPALSDAPPHAHPADRHDLLRVRGARKQPQGRQPRHGQAAAHGVFRRGRPEVDALEGLTPAIVVDLGPGAGTAGGTVVFQGSVEGLRASDTLTGQHLAAYVQG